MTFGTESFAPKKYTTINGRRMAYIDVGEGDAIVFQHGNPTSSYLWRNVMPHCKDLGRLVACDLIGMGDSEKLSASGPDSYSFFEQRDYLFGLLDSLNLGNRVILVLHDWGSALGFHWATKHRDRVQAIAYMEGIVTPVTWDDWPESGRRIFEAFRSPAGDELVLQKNAFVERVFPSSVIRPMTEAEMNVYRAPFENPGEDRRPTLSWPRQLPIGGMPEPVVEVVQDYAGCLSKWDVPKLFINAEPGSILTGRQREFCRTWPNQREVTVKGRHFIQEDSPDEIGSAVADFVRNVRQRDLSEEH